MIFYFISTSTYIRITERRNILSLIARKIPGSLLTVSHYRVCRDPRACKHGHVSARLTIPGTAILRNGYLSVNSGNYHFIMFLITVSSGLDSECNVTLYISFYVIHLQVLA